MGDFDLQIAWCRERRAVALDDLKSIARGDRHFLNDRDITEDMKARAERDVRQFDILIAAYEAHNADQEELEEAARLNRTVSDD